MPPQQSEQPKRPEKIVPLYLPPGFCRDTPTLAADRWIDGQHVRFHDKHWHKMGGYVAGNNTINGISRHLRNFWSGTSGYVHSFTSSNVDRFTITAAGTMSAVSNRTPAGLVVSGNNNWQTAVLYDEASAANVLIAHCVANLNDLGAGTATTIWYGDISNATALASTGQTTDGGICVLQPYLFKYGSNGEIAWSDANRPTTWAGGDSGSDRITGAKIIRGYSVYDADYVSGGGSGATGLFWSLDSLIKASYIGGTAIFRFSTLSNNISVLSSNAIVEHEGKFYWPGIDRFFMYDGRVKTLPNDLNGDWFFDNLNFDHRQKVWGTTIDKHANEIWWHFPYGADTECSRAIILNVKETERLQQPIWYDTQIARSAGDSPHVFRYPLWTDTNAPATLYRHETGTDAVDSAGSSTAINSYIESNVLTLADSGANDWLLLKRVEPDFTQTGNITMTVSGKEFARSSDVTSNHTITTSTTKVDLLKQHRQMRLKFASNAVSGDMQSGKILLHIQPGTGQ